MSEKGERVRDGSRSESGMGPKWALMAMEWLIYLIVYMHMQPLKNVTFSGVSKRLGFINMAIESSAFEIRLHFLPEPWSMRL